MFHLNSSLQKKSTCATFFCQVWCTLIEKSVAVYLLMRQQTPKTHLQLWTKKYIQFLMFITFIQIWYVYMNAILKTLEIWMSIACLYTDNCGRTPYSFIIYPSVNSGQVSSGKRKLNNQAWNTCTTIYLAFYA